MNSFDEILEEMKTMKQGDIVIDEDLLLQLIRVHSMHWPVYPSEWWNRPIETIEVEDNMVYINLRDSTENTREAED